jgi:hypothetical protein
MEEDANRVPDRVCLECCLDGALLVSVKIFDKRAMLPAEC